MLDTEAASTGGWNQAKTLQLDDAPRPELLLAPDGLFRWTIANKTDHSTSKNVMTGGVGAGYCRRRWTWIRDVDTLDTGLEARLSHDGVFELKAGEGEQLIVVETAGGYYRLLPAGRGD